MTNQKGYTILELMMVVCIIGVLSMVAMTEYNKVHNRAYVGAAMSDVQILRKAISMYDAEQGAFPLVEVNSPEALAALLIDPVGQPYIDAPSSKNFDSFHYQPPAAGDQYGDYSLTVICKDHWRTQITVHNSQSVEMFRLN
ncbi:prepilin-type N-terminal cleavage/methylation domain-containing protein [candidate division KSB1 bacterium]|nr:MAG: prepilin-type N-terminal cleavage/methylation domain-containing protein [candidate division KSB1 bacterium]